jgi:methionyl-tRNA formyltransferase
MLLDASAGGAAGFEIPLVVTQPPTPVGRKMRLTPSPVHALAEERGIKVLHPTKPSDDDFLRELEALQPDLCVTAAYGGFLPRRFLGIPARGTVNIHPSLLPLYRGAAPVQRAVEAGDSATGVTVLSTVLKMDAGPVLWQQGHALDPSVKSPELMADLFRIGTQGLVDILPAVLAATQPATEQPADGATAAPKMDRTEARIDLRTAMSSGPGAGMPSGGCSVAQALHNRVRAFAEWPGTWLDMIVRRRPTRVKIVTTAWAESDDSVAPTGPKFVYGPQCVRERGGRLQLTCGDGSVLEVLELQLPGKKVTDAKSFWNGLQGGEVFVAQEGSYLG